MYFLTTNEILTTKCILILANEILTTNVFFDDKRNFNDKMYFNFSK